MNMGRFILYTLFCLLLVGCTGNNQTIQEQNDQNNVSITKISSKNKKTDQHTSNEIKNMLVEYEDIDDVHIVNSKKDIVIAVNVSNFDRFRLDDIKKEIKKKVKKEYPNKQVFVSTDQKIILEVEKLENKLESSSISEGKLKKKIKEIIHLGKEET